MGLSEREQKLLDELEASLGSTSAKGAERKLAPGNVSARRVISGTLLVVAGISLLLAGVMIKSLVTGIAGFAVMLAGVYLAASTPSSK